MLRVVHFPVFSEKDDIVLPERGRGVSTADQSIITENGCKIVGLKVIDLLACDEVHRICPKQARHQFSTMFPGIGSILCQSETKIEGHYGEVIDVRVHDEMDIREKLITCQIFVRGQGAEGRSKL